MARVNSNIYAEMIVKMRKYGFLFGGELLE